MIDAGILTGVGYFLSVVMGITLGLIGAGGSILTVPILVYFFNVNPVLATSYSLIIVGAIAIPGTLRHYKQIEFKITFLFCLPSILAVYLTRRFALPAIPDYVTFVSMDFSKDSIVMLVFVGLMLLSSIMMIRDNNDIKADEVSHLNIYKILMIFFEGSLVGFITGIVGAGGGFLIVPVLLLLVGLSMKKAIAGSLLIISLKSLIGFVGDAQIGVSLNYVLLLSFVALAIVGMFIGSYMSNKLPSTILKKGFGWFTLCIAIVILFKEFRIIL